MLSCPNFRGALAPPPLASLVAMSMILMVVKSCIVSSWQVSIGNSLFQVLDNKLHYIPPGSVPSGTVVPAVVVPVLVILLIAVVCVVFIVLVVRKKYRAKELHLAAEMRELKIYSKDESEYINVLLDINSVNVCSF